MMSGLVVVTRFGEAPSKVRFPGEVSSYWNHVLEFLDFAPRLCDYRSASGYLVRSPSLMIYEFREPDEKNRDFSKLLEGESMHFSRLAAESTINGVPVMAVMSAATLEHIAHRPELRQQYVKAAAASIAVVETPLVRTDLELAIKSSVAVSEEEKNPMLELRDVPEYVYGLIYNDIARGMRKSPACLDKGVIKRGLALIPYERNETVVKQKVAYRIIRHDGAFDSHQFQIAPETFDNEPSRQAGLLQFAFLLRAAHYRTFGFPEERTRMTCRLQL